MRVAAKLAGVAALLLVAAPAKAQTPVVFGDTISDPGVYFLAGNQSGGGDGIKIESDDVTLLLLRFTLRGDGTGVGITIDGYDNVTVYGGRVTRFETGIELEGSDYCTVKDVRFDHCSEAGLDADDADDCWFLRVRCDNNDQNGLEAEGCDNGRFISILAHDNGWDGIHLGYDKDDGCDDNKVRLCWASYNGRNGIRLKNSDDNEVKRNQCVNNSEAGIRLEGEERELLGDNEDGADDNELESNWCVFNALGISIEEGSTGNELTNNTALANFHLDMFDDNPEPPCENTWFLNFFLFRGGDGEDCIF